ncbi:hypothetical protein V5E97_27425 [Singulisphaera sp. Ch08]|uniref:Uncharacterized protein n=1 Tax=Singulisphaera sp. Ch08 TaxID=3120278 RepID=A0AAU7CA81_9BACT
MTHLAIALSELTTAALWQAVKRGTPHPANVDTPHQSMDRLSLSCENRHDDPKEDLDHLSLTSEEHRTDSDDDRWM